MSSYFKVPETREEVIEHFKTYPDKFFSEVMTELFLLYHDNMGKSVTQAYEDTLRAAIEETPNNRLHSDAGESADLEAVFEPLHFPTSQAESKSALRW